MAKTPQRPRKKTAKKTAKKSTKKSTKKTVSKRAVKSRPRAPKKRAKASRSRRWPARLLALSFLFFLGLGIYLLYLDHTVREKFEGKRWAIPARVYGQPLEIYSGMAVTPQRLEAELKQLGYRKAGRALKPGTWSRHQERFLVRTRGFRFWDSDEPARHLEISFSSGRLNSLRHVGGAELPLMRLEAPEIGSIYPAHNEDRVLVQHNALPKQLVQGLIATEDRNFYQHQGVAPRSIARALLANLRAGGVVQGGSTLTQQLVKNFYLTRERSLWRKVNEAAMALLLEAHYGKDEILEAYANEIYLGQDGGRAIHGFGLAARFYFNQGLEELNLSRQALLVALVRGPSYYDPRRHPRRAKERRNLVLEMMRDQGLITAGEYKGAATAPLGIDSSKGRGKGRYPAFMSLVRRQLHRDYREEDLNSEGLRIFTTLDPWTQGRVESRVARKLSKLEKKHALPTGKLESAAVLVDSQSGEVRALVGGRHPGYAGFNRALDAVRPIGSLVKPAVYLAALMQPERYTLLTPLDDAPLTLKGADGVLWSPGNYDKKSHGLVPLHQALAKSYNLSTVRLGLDIGLDRVAELLRQMGMSRPLTPVPAMLLGAVSLSPLEVAQLYQGFAAGGFYSPLRAIRAVQSSDGEPLQRYPLTVRQAVPAGPVYLLNRNLQEVTRSGTGRGLSSYLDKNLNIAGKTGTTDDLRDSWFAGFSGDRVAVVWLGRDDNKPAGLSGSKGALQVWGDMMGELQPAPLELLKPDSIETVWVDPASGFLADESCDEARRFPFVEGSAPKTRSSCIGRGGGAVERFFRSFFE
ncbi:MAG: penicillin-binding protein 1B [Candidatus Sedimenticola sp. (ex Thyasira tokunagai)]